MISRAAIAALLGIALAGCVATSTPPPGTPSAPPTPTPAPTPVTACGPIPSLAPDARQPVLTCAHAIAEALAWISPGRGEIKRIQFGYGGLCPSGPAGCGGSPDVIGGFVLVEFVAGPGVLISMIEPSEADGIRVTNVQELGPLASPQPYSITVRNRSHLTVCVGVVTDASGWDVGLRPGEAATVPLLLQDPENGVSFEVNSAETLELLTSATFTTPDAIVVSISDATGPEPVALSARAAASAAPIPLPSNGITCPGG